MKNLFLKITFSLLGAAMLISFMVPGSKTKVYTLAFYNVENLYDTIDDPTIPDEEYLPSGEKKWNTQKYKIKLNNLAKVISNLNNGNVPVVLGMAEIENSNVLKDLIKTEKLKNYKFRYVHQNSPDERGIDVAAIYRSDIFKLSSYKYFALKFEDDPSDKTRDILYMKGTINKNEVHIFYNHWPSRIGGEEKSDSKRIAAARVVKTRVDSLLKINKDARIIIMGDFNDYPTNTSISETLHAGKDLAEGKTLINLAYAPHAAKQGTHAYKGEWGMLDQIIVSKGWMESKKGVCITNSEAVIFKPEWLLYTNKNGEQSPSRSFSGNKFHETGYSDHLPVFTEISFK